jgi:tetratricopeptide (TPR) repeat protein
MKQWLIILISLFLIPAYSENLCLAQKYHTTSAKALKYYKAGMTAFDYIDYINAENYFNQAIETDNNFYEAYMMLGDLLSKLKRFGDAARNYQKAVSLDSTAYMPVFFNLATAELMSGDYEKALLHYNVYLAQDNISEKNRLLASRNIRNCEFAIEAVKKPVPSVLKVSAKG